MTPIPVSANHRQEGSKSQHWVYGNSESKEKDERLREWINKCFPRNNMDRAEREYAVAPAQKALDFLSHEYANYINGQELDRDWHRYREALEVLREAEPQLYSSVGHSIEKEAEFVTKSLRSISLLYKLNPLRILLRAGESLGLYPLNFKKRRPEEYIKKQFKDRLFQGKGRPPKGEEDKITTVDLEKKTGFERSYISRFLRGEEDNPSALLVNSTWLALGGLMHGCDPDAYVEDSSRSQGSSSDGR